MLNIITNTFFEYFRTAEMAKSIRGNTLLQKTALINTISYFSETCSINTKLNYQDFRATMDVEKKLLNNSGWVNRTPLILVITATLY